MRTFTRRSRKPWLTRFTNNIRVLGVLFLLNFLLLDSHAQSIQNLDQAANNDYLNYTSPMTWQNGNLNSNQAHFIEGHSVPYRAIMKSLPAGKKVTITFGFDLVNSNKYALDFITGYQWLKPHNYVNHSTEEAVDPTASSGTSFALGSAPNDWKTINPASYLTDYTGQPAATAAKAAVAYSDFQNIQASGNAAGKIALWGGTFTSEDITYAYKQNNSTIDKVQLLNLTIGDTKVEWTISFTATGGDAIIAFGGHIARKQDWGLGLTAGGLTGSPYHTRERSWVVDGNAANLGSADRSLKVALSEPTCPPDLCTSVICDNVCPGSTQTFKVPATSSATSYEWSIINNTAGASFVGGTPATTDSTATVTNTQAGSYTIQVVLANGSGFVTTCTKTVNVTATPPPTAVNNSRCGAGAVQISVTGCSGDVKWYATASGGDPIATGSSYTPTISSTTTYYASCTDARGCESARVAVEAKINTIPTATATSDSKCSSTPGTTTASFNLNNYVSTIIGSQTGVTVTWFSNAGLTTAITGGSVTAYSVNGTATVYAKVSNDTTSCSSSAAVDLSVNPTPEGSASPATICSGATTNVTLSSTVTGTTFTWTAAHQSGATITGFSNCTSGCGTAIQQTLTNTGATAGVVRYTVTPTAGGCSGATFTVDVPVNPKPTVNSISDRTHCNGDAGAAITFSGAVSGTTFTWSSTANVGFGTSGTTDISAYTAANSGTSPVTATVTVTPSANNCSGPSTSFMVTVNPTPGGSADAATICSGATTNVALHSTVSGTTFTWTAAHQSGATITGFSNCTSGCGAAIQQTLTNTGTTNGVVRYTVTPTANGCVGTAFTVDVTVRPTLDAAISGTATICAGNSTNITFSGTVGTIISYNVNGGTTQTATLNGSGEYVLSTGNLSATTTYNLTSVKYATDPACPQPLNKSVTVTVRPSLDANISGATTICAGNGTDITFSGTAGTVISYKVGASGTVQTATLNNSGQFVLATGNLSATTTYYLTAVQYATTPNCPQPLDKSVTVTVNAIPVLVITNPEAVCAPNVVNLTAAAVTAGSTWPSGTTLSYFESDGTTPLAHPEAVSASGTYVIKATGAAPSNCWDSKQVTVSITSCAVTYCTYTQGYYGNAKGSSCSPAGKKTTEGLIAYALDNMSNDKLYIGASGKSFTVRLHALGGADNSDIQGLITVLPGGGKSSVLPGGDVYANSVPGGMLKNGRLSNQLLAQTITMGLNMYITTALQGLVLRSDMPLVSYGKTVSGCDVSNTTINPCDVRSKNLNAKVIKYLQNTSGDGKARVSALFNLASAVLGGMTLPVVGNGDTYRLTLEDISSVEDDINNVFDECRLFNGYGEIAPCPELVTSTSSARTAQTELAAASVDKLTVTAYPNPFTDVVKFTIQSNVSGQAQLEVLNLLGQRIATVYNGHLQANRSQVVEYRVPATAQQNLIYLLKIGGQQVTGKLLRRK